MRIEKRTLLTAAILVALAPVALADDLPDANDTSTTSISDPNFGVYTVTKTVQVWAPDNASNPCPGTPGFCYVYTVANQPTSSLGIEGFDVTVASGSVTAAGFLAGSGVAPDGAPSITSTNVRWTFFNTSIAPGQTSEHLYIDSPFGPSATDVTVLGAFGLDAAGVCLGPIVPPGTSGEPNPCTIGFWKNRSEGKKGLLKYFPDGDFDAVVAEAVSLSTVFADANELLTALQSKGNRTVLERAEQQFAAFLLNVAAGNLFPDNQKCKLFTLNNVDTDGDGVADLTVGEALTLLESNILSGDPDLEHAALELADDINNGIGVTQ